MLLTPKTMATFRSRRPMACPPSDCSQA